MATTVNGYSVNQVGEAADWSPREFALLSAFASLMPTSGSRVVSAGEHYHNVLTNASGEEKLFVSGSNIGIGTSTPSHQLQIYSFSNAYICMSGNTCAEYGLIFAPSINDQNKLVYKSFGPEFDFYLSGGLVLRVGGVFPEDTGTITVSALQGSGNRAVYSDSNGRLTNTTSDKLLKKDIEILDIESCLLQVNQLRPVSYYWINEKKFGGRQEIGLIAQEVDEVVPEVIGINADGNLSLDYARLVTTLIGAVKELTLKINDLQNQIDELK